MTRSGRVHRLSVASMGAALRAREITSAEITGRCLERIGELDDDVHAFVIRDADAAMRAADAADRDFARGVDRGPLQGIPYAAKDNFDVAGLPTQCNSRLLSRNIASADSACVAALRAAGAVLVGKLAMTELAYGLNTDDVPFPLVRNPWHLDHMPGGSSSGPAAAVAAEFVPLALGSDTSSSVRGPAAYCGVVGLKPTFGRVSRRGVWPLSATLDHGGTLTRTVRDAAQALQVIAGWDPDDAASADVPVGDVAASLDAGVAGLRIAVPRHFFADAPGLSEDVLRAFDATLELLRGFGARVEEVRLPDYDLFDAAGRIILAAEAFALYEAALRDRGHDVGRDFYERVVPGLALGADDLVRAHDLRRHLTRLLDQEVFPRYDAIVCVTCLTAAPPFVSRSGVAPINPTQTMPFSLTGHPALAMPMGFSGGLPTSLQIVGRPFDEAMVLRVGHRLEAELGSMMGVRPPFLGGLAALPAVAGRETSGRPLEMRLGHG